MLHGFAQRHWLVSRFERIVAQLQHYKPRVVLKGECADASLLRLYAFGPRQLPLGEAPLFIGSHKMRDDSGPDPVHRMVLFAIIILLVIGIAVIVTLLLLVPALPAMLQ
jgi:hypothetical protein